MSTTFAVLGDGAWGTALAILLAARADHRVRLWSARAEYGLLLQQARENARLLPGVRIPETVALTCDIREAVAGADYWLTAIPTIHLRSTLARIRAEVSGETPPVVSLTKGIEVGSFRRPSEIIREELGADNIAVLSGPSHAEEVSRGQPTVVVAACEDVALARHIQWHFNTERFRVYTNDDPRGVELGGALKNVVGIAAGMGDGLGFGDNARSALLTRGLVEMTRLGAALGARPATFAGLAGLGDLMTTCFSKHGRNRLFGERLAKGESREAILASSNKIAEGVSTARAVRYLSQSLSVETPIMAEVYRVLYEGKSPRDAATDLMLRSPREEDWPT